MSEIPRSLGPGVAEVVAAGNNPVLTLDLRTLKEGDLLRICLKGSRRNPWDFRVVKPPPPGAGMDGKLALEAALPFRTWDLDALDPGEKTVSVFILGACTYNPGAPLGMSMLQFHHLTVGRSACAFGPPKGSTEGEEQVVFAKPVESIEVITPHAPEDQQ